MNADPADSSGDSAPQDGPAQALAECLERSRRLASLVEPLLREREPEILALGGELQGIAWGLEALESTMLGLTAFVDGGGVRRTARRLEEQTARFAALCSADGLDSRSREFRAIAAAAAGLEETGHVFRRIVRTLRMLGVSTRIESARLGQEGRDFATLAEAVAGLVDKIVADADHLRERSAELGRLAAEAAGRAERARGERSGAAAEIRELLGRDGEIFSDVFASAGRAAEALAESMRQARENVSGVVASLQFHDIVRQQVEHVARVLEGLEEALGTSGDASGREAELLSWTAEVCVLQAAQLADGRDRFLRAMEAGLDHVRRGAAEVEDIGRSALLTSAPPAPSAPSAPSGPSGPSGEHDGRRGTALDAVIAGVDAAAATLREFIALGERTAEANAGVSSAVGQMIRFVNDIEDVGAEIELISLNASVKSARKGRDGAALGVLASAIQTLSVEARNETGVIADRIAAVERSSAALAREQGDQGDQGESGRRDCLDGLLGLLAPLRAADAELAARIGAVEARGAELAGGMRALAASVSVHVEVASALDAARAEAEAVAALAGRFSAGRVAGDRPEGLDRLFDLYAMEAQRAIHRDMVVAAVNADGPVMPGVPGASGAPGAAMQAADSDLGDNVELF